MDSGVVSLVWDSVLYPDGRDPRPHATTERGGRDAQGGGNPSAHVLDATRGGWRLNKSPKIRSGAENLPWAQRPKIFEPFILLVDTVLIIC